MENTKTVKVLKKQLMAAIAMVLVAAIALGSATYAWFVSNNKVTGTTTTISAQSNSAYLVIANKADGKTSTSSTDKTTASETFEAPADTKIFPAQWKNNFDDAGKLVGTDEGAGAAVYQFESAYASDKTKSTEKTGTRFPVGDPDTAVSKDYALMNTFYIGTGTYDGTFKDLKVTNVEVNNTSNSQLESAMRVLVKCGDAWTVWSAAGKESSSDTDGIIKAAGITKGTDAEVNVYVYYDGADENVYTTNLDKLKECGVTVTFEATPVEFK